MSKGNIFVISAASGTGKTTLVSRLVQQPPNVRVSVSHTTRPPRAGEVNGQHYHFVSEEEFVRLAGEGAFLEHAQVFGNYYGTSYESVQSMCEQGYDVILEIDVQGAQQIRKALPEALSIFILPPSLAVLEQRLRQRQTDSEEVIARRLSEAVDEIQQALTFDYVVSNRSLQQAEEELWCIFQAARLLKRNHVASIEKVLQNT